MQLLRLSSHLGQTWATTSPASSKAPAPCPHPSADLAPPVWGRMVTKRSHHPALLPLAGYPSGTCLSAVSKDRLNAAGARAFGNCTPRLWNSLTAYRPAKRRLQHFSLLEHVRQRSWHLCPLDPTAPCQRRGGKLFYEDVCCLFSCQKIQGLGFFALPSIHYQLFLGSCLSQNSLQFRCHWQLFPMSALARFQTEKNFIAQSYSLVYLHMGEKGRVRDRFVEFCLLVTGSQVKTSPSDKPSADMFN